MTLPFDNLIGRLSNRAAAPLFIPEIADAHYGSLERAFLFVDQAVEHGFEIVKFQHHLPDEEMLRDIPQSRNMREPLYEFLVKNALSLGQHIELKAYCDTKGIHYLCTPFSWRAAQELEESISPIAYKIGSGEMLDFPTIRRIQGFKKPIIVSTGMSTRAEVDELYGVFRDYQYGSVFMNCTSAYPPSPSDMHITFISEMMSAYPGVFIGHSDHTTEPDFTIAAVALGARVIEKHVTLDHSLLGPDSDVSLTMADLAVLRDRAKLISTVLSNEKRIQSGEFEIREWAHRSLVFLRDLPAGHRISDDDIWGKRPGTGIPARFRDRYIGRSLTRPVLANSLALEDDFEA